MTWARQLFRHPHSVDTWLALVVLPVGCGAVLGEAYCRTNLADADCPPRQYAPSTALLTPARVRELETYGRVVIPAALSRKQLEGVRRNVQTLRMGRNGNDDDVRQDSVVWVRSDDCKNLIDLNQAVYLVRGVGHALTAAGYKGADEFVVPQDCQLAKYPGDGKSGYARHLDRCTETLSDLGLLEYWRLSDVRNRVVTAILYLNDRSRKVEEGGALRCWMDDDDVENFFDVQPTGGTLIVFDANRISHQVMPSQSARTALTCWFNGNLL